MADGADIAYQIAAKTVEDFNAGNGPFTLVATKGGVEQGKVVDAYFAVQRRVDGATIEVMPPASEWPWDNPDSVAIFDRDGVKFGHDL